MCDMLEGEWLKEEENVELASSTNRGCCCTFELTSSLSRHLSLLSQSRSECVYDEPSKSKGRMKQLEEKIGSLSSSSVLLLRSVVANLRFLSLQLRSKTSSLERTRRTQLQLPTVSQP